MIFKFCDFFQLAVTKVNFNKTSCFRTEKKPKNIYVIYKILLIKFTVPVSCVHSEAESIPNTPSSSLSLQSTSFTNKGLLQGTHLTTFMIP